MGNSANKQTIVDNTTNKRTRWLLQCDAHILYDDENNTQNAQWFKVQETFWTIDGYDPLSLFTRNTAIKNVVRHYVQRVTKTSEPNIIILRVANINCGTVSEQCVQEFVQSQGKSLPPNPYLDCWTCDDIID